MATRREDGLEWQAQGDAVTAGVRVAVETAFVPERSVPHGRGWFYAYRITIANEGATPLQLMVRHWVITDAFGRREHVDGPGVVGEQPVIEPGAAFQYTSFCPLATEFGTMEGSYDMVTADGATRTVAIPKFVLVRAESVH